MLQFVEDIQEFLGRMKKLLRRDNQDIKDFEGGEVSKSVARCWWVKERDTEKPGKEREIWTVGMIQQAWICTRWCVDMRRKYQHFRWFSLKIKIKDALLILLQIDTSTWFFFFFLFFFFKAYSYWGNIYLKCKFCHIIIFQHFLNY